MPATLNAGKILCYAKVVITTIILLAYGEANASSYIKKELRGTDFIADFYFRDSLKNQKPIVILGGSEGGNEFSKQHQKIEQLLSIGYAVLALEYFNYDGDYSLPSRLERIPLEYFEKAMDWLSEKEFLADGVTIYGGSRGAELALLLATRYGEVDEVIAVSPSAYTWGAHYKSRLTAIYKAVVDPCASAFKYRNSDIPSICASMIKDYSPWYSIIDDPEEVQDYFIPVENMSADLLILSGIQDKVWPSHKMATRIVKRLKESDYKYKVEHISYPAGHNILDSSWPDVMKFLSRRVDRTDNHSQRRQ